MSIIKNLIKKLLVSFSLVILLIITIKIFCKRENDIESFEMKFQTGDKDVTIDTDKLLTNLSTDEKDKLEQYGITFQPVQSKSQVAENASEIKVDSNKNQQQKKVNTLSQNTTQQNTTQQNSK